VDEDGEAVGAQVKERMDPVAGIRFWIVRLESWHVDDPLSPFVGEEVISREEVMDILNDFRDGTKTSTVARRAKSGRSNVKTARRRVR
jgi:hypothetical protein